MSYRCIVLDFDGTFTDVEAEGRRFSEAFPHYLADLLGGLNPGEWDAALEEVRVQSPELGWIMDGHAAAPADADPYVRSSGAARKIFDRRGVLQDEELRSGVISTLYRRAYAHTEDVLRPHAETVLQELLRRGLPVYVVTNSSTQVVSAKIAKLGLGSNVPVIGDAQKFGVDDRSLGDPRFDGLPAELRADGLARPIFLKRRKYFQTLQTIWQTTGTDPASTLVCGDIWELDLAMPAALGAGVHLMERGNTYSYERNAVASYGPRASVGPDLRALLERI